MTQKTYKVLDSGETVRVLQGGVLRPLKQLMTARDYAEQFMETHEFSNLLDEMYWERAGSVIECDADYLLARMKDAARRDGIELLNLDAFDYEAAFSAAYDAAELGLS